jgi:phosphorylcholine metabolism protein LicD
MTQFFAEYKIQYFIQSLTLSWVLMNSYLIPSQILIEILASKC